MFLIIAYYFVCKHNIIHVSYMHVHVHVYKYSVSSLVSRLSNVILEEIWKAKSIVWCDDDVYTFICDMDTNLHLLTCTYSAHTRKSLLHDIVQLQTWWTLQAQVIIVVDYWLQHGFTRPPLKYYIIGLHLTSTGYDRLHGLSDRLLGGNGIIILL